MTYRVKKGQIALAIPPFNDAEDAFSGDTTKLFSLDDLSKKTSPLASD
jgi:hypothetical protein